MKINILQVTIFKSNLSLQIEHKQKQEKEGSRIDWRRSKVQELSSQGHSQREIAQILQVSNGTVNRDHAQTILLAKERALFPLAL